MSLDLRRVLVLGIVAFVVHNGEEALTMPGWLESQFPTVSRRLCLPRLDPPSPERLYLGLFLVTVVPAVAVAVGARGPAGSPGVYLCLFVYGVLFWNALVPHVALAILLKSYNPGLATAALVSLPYTTYLFGRMLRERQVTRTGLAVALGLAAVFYPLGLAALWQPRLPG